VCRPLPGALEDYPFGDGVAVFKVGGRMFVLVRLEGTSGKVNLKCYPDLLTRTYGTLKKIFFTTEERSG
jgi:predicted DNA-binding protein (MmcQ/YjbR family)